MPKKTLQKKRQQFDKYYERLTKQKPSCSVLKNKNLLTLEKLQKCINQLKATCEHVEKHEERFSLQKEKMALALQALK